MAERAPTPRNQYSFSRVKTYFQCPQRYRFRYLAGRREAFRSVEAFLGTSVHLVLEWLYRERQRAASPTLAATLDELAARWQAGWGDDVAVVRLDDSADAAFLLAREMLARFHSDTYQRDASETVALEQRFSLQLTPDIMFTGIADRVGRTGSGRLFVVDYKSARSRGSSDDFSEGLQAPLYAGLAMRQAGDSDALAGYHYLRFGATSWHVVTSELAGRLLHRFTGLARQAASATDFPPCPGILCAWCGFNADCAEAQVPAGLEGGLRLARERASG
jgi:putative RecB family exonuclease